MKISTKLRLLCLLIINLLTISVFSFSEQQIELSVDGEKAFQHVANIVGYGPHPSGSKAIKEVQKYIVNKLKEYELTVREDTFIASTPIGEKEMKNITGIIPGKSKKIIIIASHYESKYFKNFVFVGANDSGSSTGLLLELARVLKSRDNLFTYWLIFFDGEESFVEWTPTDSLYGSRYMVLKLAEEHILRDVRAMILLDMVGDKNLTLNKEYLSTQWLRDIIWNVAKKSGYGKIFLDKTRLVMDDHLPFLMANVPSVNIIDVSIMGSTGGTDPHKYWHTEQDTIDKISSKSLEIVGNVLLKSLDKIEEKLRSN